MTASLDHIRQRLQQAFRDELAKELKRDYLLLIGAQHHLHLAIEHGRLEVRDEPCPEPSVTLMFPDLDVALGLLEGSLDPMQAFLEGQFRSDGNLILALQLLGLFRR